MKTAHERVLIVSDEEGHWYIRRVAYSVNRGDEVVYHCDEHLGGPFPTPEKALSHYRASKRDPKWETYAKAAIAAVARRMDSLTTDHVWEELAADGIRGGDPRAIGPIMNAAAVDGLIERTEETVPSTRRECHGRPVRVWISHVKRK